MDLEQETIFCRKRFYKWAEEQSPGFHPKDIKKYYDLFDRYIRLLDPVQLMQEWRVGHNWKRDRIQKLWVYYEKEYGEIWYPKGSQV